MGITASHSSLWNWRLGVRCSDAGLISHKVCSFRFILFLCTGMAAPTTACDMYVWVGTVPMLNITFHNVKHHSNCTMCIYVLSLIVFPSLAGFVLRAIVSTYRLHFKNFFTCYLIIDKISNNSTYSTLCLIFQWQYPLSQRTDPSFIPSSNWPSADPFYQTCIYYINMYYH